MNLFWLTLRRELVLAWRRRVDGLTALAFLVMVAVLFPFGVGAQTEPLRAIGPGVLWIAVLLANLLALPRLFEPDQHNGTFEQLWLSPRAAVVWVSGKVLAHWLVTALPLVVLAPALGLLFDLSAREIQVLMLSLLLGSPLLSLLGGLGAALTLGAGQAAALTAILVFPLQVPVLIFGVGAVDTLRGGLSAQPQLLLLAGGSLIGLAILPWVISAALRLTTD